MTPRAPYTGKLPKCCVSLEWPVGATWQGGEELCQVYKEQFSSAEGRDGQKPNIATSDFGLRLPPALGTLKDQFNTVQYQETDDSHTLIPSGEGRELLVQLTQLHCCSIWYVYSGFL